ncbi:hypothetical protein BB559_002138 [Furculomyces boomerangus]|uniref:assimilatory sulfite reductase (NADPH) n=2 Tax=Harpellales TaxID=61421 RepID=A0A2T9YXU0_9FUNG|nr:hypothetical protein BB559_002138 [Furculomyces boomerangus]PVZ99991.1 hypothetical protein BB558_003976 [Smittium angustum]
MLNVLPASQKPLNSQTTALRDGSTDENTRVNSNTDSPILKGSLQYDQDMAETAELDLNAIKQKLVSLKELEKLEVSPTNSLKNRILDPIISATNVFSDVVIYYGLDATFENNVREHGLYTTTTKNIYGRPTLSTFSETRDGAGLLALGITDSNAKVSVVTTIDSILFLKRNIFKYSDKLQNVVFHILCKEGNGQEDSFAGFNEALSFDFLNPIILSSSTNQEAHDIATVSHILSESLNTPVFHLFIGKSTKTVTEPVNVVNADSIKSFNKKFNSLNSVDKVFNAYNTYYSKEYSLYSLSGPSDPKKLVISLCNTIQSVGEHDSDTKSSAGFLSIRVYQPNVGNKLVTLLPKSVEKVLVLGSGYLGLETSRLHLDLLAGFYLYEPSRRVEFYYENSYGLSQKQISNLLNVFESANTKPEFEASWAESKNSELEEDEEFSEQEEVVEDSKSASTEVSIASDFRISERFELEKAIAFSEEFGSSLSVSQDFSPVHRIKVLKKVRLTPESYDRNLFHIEFDTENTGLKYSIGEALGVFGQNDAKEVEEFLNWYNVESNMQVIKNINGKQETNTAFHWFKQRLDVFGRPGKKFYEFLSKHATDKKEQEQLTWIISSAGKEDLKNRVERTTTYADLLREFTSAHPPVQTLIENIPHIKQRHYSISSSSNMHPNRVHLLIVTVDWNVDKETKRYGLCTRYLDQLVSGDEVLVSVKPSAMKLPEDDMAPVVMAGLGTGMAPFMAFIQERSYRKSLGIEVGPMALYFGSRNRRMEYLYGEDLEAFNTEGVLTKLRLAFSRDQKQKVYIQHKLKSDAEMLTDWLLEKKGSFYLCGPTWPVPDVKDAIIHSFTNFGGMNKANANKTIEEMKEHERYVLEVY